MPLISDTIFALILVALLIVASYRALGLTFSILIAAFIAYGFLGQFIPGQWGHSGFTLDRFVYMNYMYADVGIWGLTMEVGVELVLIFILYSALLRVLGGSEFFLNIANALLGRFRGGPAKMAIVASALFGTVSGSAVANVVGTGCITIPLMKRLGYKSHFAGAVEAVSSTGGQIMPPIMGAAAFIMAAVLGISYWSVVVAATLPAVLYFAAVFIMVHLEAVKSGLKGVPAEERPKIGATLKKGWLLLFSPITLVIMLGWFRSSVGLAGLYAIVILLALYVIAEIARSKGKGWKNIIKALINGLEDGGRGSGDITIALASVGIIIGVLGITGLGMKLSGLLVDLAGGNLFLLAPLVMVAALIMGMGLPTSAVYVILAVTAAPALVKMGTTVIAAHMFVFYFGVLATVTPPVALASFAAAGIAKAPIMKLSITAVRLALTGLILPFFFLLNPSLLLQGELLSIIKAIVTAVIGITLLATGLQGYLLGKIILLQRILLIAAALLLLDPGSITDLIGLAIGILVLLWHFVEVRRLRFISPPPINS